MKVKFIGTTTMISKGLHLIPGGVYEVRAEVADYLEKAFGCIEKVAEEKPVVKAEAKAEEKPVVKAEAKAEEKPKVGTKVVPNK
jgi:hypothetical protein